jgi:hypothetical protein
MIPPNGSYDFISSSGNLNAPLTGQTLTGNCTTGSNLLIVTSIPVALDGIRTAAGLFLNNATNFPIGTREIASRSPIGYTISAATFSSPNVTITLSDTMPVAALANQVLTFTGTSNSYFLNGSFLANAGATTTSITFTTGTDPGVASLVGAKVVPGIVDSVAGTGDGGKGYYTLNQNAVATVTGAALTTAAVTPMQVPINATHVIALSATATSANIIVDGFPANVVVPCQQLLSFKRLKGGSYFMRSGTASGTDVLSLLYATVNPFGS